jgi:hypothetical protein
MVMKALAAAKAFVKAAIPTTTDRPSQPSWAQDALSPVLARTAPLLGRRCPPGSGMLREARQGSDQYDLAPSAAQLKDWRLPIASNPGRY